MPIQKGKKRRRERRHGPRIADEQLESDSAASDVKPSRSRVSRRGWTPPLWVNAAFGFGMLVFGGLFALNPPKGESPGLRAALLLGYTAIAGFYLARAYRQYRARRES